MNQEVNKSPDWTVQLRGGIRGGTEAEILSNLRLSATGRPTIMRPKGQDRTAYWLSCTNRERHQLLENSVAVLFQLTDKLGGRFRA